MMQWEFLKLFIHDNVVNDKIYTMSNCIIVLDVPVLSWVKRACSEKKRSSRFLTRSHTNQAVQPHKMARSLKFPI